LSSAWIDLTHALTLKFFMVFFCHPIPCAKIEATSSIH
jgi:hypothetical protein